MRFDKVKKDVDKYLEKDYKALRAIDMERVCEYHKTKDGAFHCIATTQTSCRHCRAFAISYLGRLELLFAKCKAAEHKVETMKAELDAANELISIQNGKERRLDRIMDSYDGMVMKEDVIQMLSEMITDNMSAASRSIINRAIRNIDRMTVMTDSDGLNPGDVPADKEGKDE